MNYFIYDHLLKRGAVFMLKGLGIAVVVCLCASVAWAADPETEKLQAQIRQLQAEKALLTRQLQAKDAEIKQLRATAGAPSDAKAAENVTEQEGAASVGAKGALADKAVAGKAGDLKAVREDLESTKLKLTQAQAQVVATEERYDKISSTRRYDDKQVYTNRQIKDAAADMRKAEAEVKRLQTRIAQDERKLRDGGDTTAKSSSTKP